MDTLSEAAGSAGGQAEPARKWANRIVGTGEEDPDRLLANPRNWRLHPQEQQDALSAVLERVGWVQHCVVNRRTGFIVDGHARVEMAIAAGERVPVVYVDLTDAEEKLVLASFDRISAMAGIDDEKLNELIAEASAAFPDMAGVLGIIADALGDVDVEQPAAGLTDPDETPPAPAEPVTRPGDIWLLGNHRVICGDSTDAATVARLLGKKKPILMVTDPPYGIELDSEWRDRAGLNGGKVGHRTKADKAAAAIHPAAPAEPSYMKHRTEGHTETTISGDTRADWSDAFALVPSLEVGYVWHASKYTREVLDGLLRIGFLHHQQIIWNKGRTVLTRTHYWFQHEPCWYVRKKNAPWFGKPGENSTVWDSPSPKFIMGGSDEEKFDHPTQKPVELMRRPILNHTKRGGLVYEPFLGSGTGLIGAEMTERVCLGIELDPKYVDVVVQRWQSFAGKEATLEGDGRTFAHVAKARKVPA